MAYSDFTLRDLRKKFGIKDRQQILFDRHGIELVLPTENLLSDIESGKMLPHLSEKAKSEFFITPVLRELFMKNNYQFNIFSGFLFDVDKSKGLTGTCDYLLTKSMHTIEISAPVFCLVEAKSRAVEEGIAQAGAEMIAARMFNEEDENPTPIVYGCVTNAFEWLFLRLEGDTLYYDSERYFLDEANLPLLLGVLNKIINSF